MNSRQFVLISLLITLVTISCKNTFEANDVVKLVADAGPDQTTIAGSYVFLDVSKSTGAIDWYEWEQVGGNPGKVVLFSGEDKDKEFVSFNKEGLYKFRLTVKSGEQSSNTDETQVKVLANPNSRFEDANLEIMIRVALNLQIDELTDNTLLMLDSLKSIVTPNYVSSLSGLEYCKNLNYLYMNFQNISDISPLATLTKLKVLSLNQTHLIKDISPLTDLTELEDLDISCNLIQDISPLANLTQLKKLDMQYNENIKDISVLKNLIQLEDLRMAEASIMDLTSLQNLTKLETLWFCDCGLEDISPLSHLTNIITLKLADGNIVDISPLAKMVKLEWVALELNKISDLSPLQNLTKLKYIRLWNNQIQNIKPLVDNLDIGKNDVVGLNNNPLNDISINQYIPILQSREIYITW